VDGETFMMSINIFLIFINDLPEYVTSNARLFADDCLLYRVINNDQDQLQNDLQQLEILEKKWQMQLNMWLFQLKSELNVTPRYLLSLVTSSMWLCRV
jgi:hypothetical protein